MKIRKIKFDDLSVRVEWLNSPEVYSGVHIIPPVSLENTINWYNKNQSINNRYDMVFLDDSNEMVAMGGLTNIDNQIRKGELYIFVNPQKQRQGLGNMACRLLCNYGFEILNLNKIFLYTNSDNIGAQKLYEKIGFQKEGVFREEMIRDGKYLDRLYYGLLFSDFLHNEDPIIFA